MKTIQQINKLIQDPTFRANLVNDASAYAPQLGYVKIEGIDFKVVTNTKAISYYVMPSNTVELYGEIDQLQAGNKASTAGSVGSAGSVLTVFSTVSSVGSVSTVGTAASTGDVTIIKK